jgi:hypothetical protein
VSNLRNLVLVFATVAAVLSSKCALAQRCGTQAPDAASGLDASNAVKRKLETGFLGYTGEMLVELDFSSLGLTKRAAIAAGLILADLLNGRVSNTNCQIGFALTNVDVISVVVPRVSGELYT